MVTNTSSTPAPLHPPCGNARRTAWRAWWHWTVMVALGEVVGFGIPVLIGASAYALRLPESILHTAVIVGGMGEGIVLGLAQWLVLRQYVPRLSARAWVLATGAGALLAWVIGMGVANVGPTVWQRSPPLFITVAGVLTVVFLLSMGGAQWLVLRRHVGHAGWWIAASALAWPLGVAVPVVGMALVPDGSAATTMAVVGVLSGLLMGMVVGAVTGVAFVSMLLPGQAAPAPMARG